MPADLEDRLRDGLAEAARRFPSPPDLRDRVGARVAASRRHHRVLAAAAVAAMVGAGGATWVAWPDGGPDRGRRVAAVPGPHAGGAEWVAGSDPRLGWHFEHPAGWTVQRYSDQCRIGAYGTIITNLDRPLAFEARERGCTTAWDVGGLPAGMVGVALGHYSGGPFTAPSLGPDTAFPLSLAAAAPPTTGPGAVDEPASTSLPVVLGGDSRYRVQVWFGPEATAADRAAAERIVASIRPGDPATATAGKQPFSVGHFSTLAVVEDVELVRSQDRVRTLTFASWDSGPRRTFTVTRRVGDPLDLRFVGEAERTTVQGHEAAVGRDGPSLALTWVPQEGVTLSVASADLSEAELRAVAESLVYRPEADDLTPVGSAGTGR